MVIHKELQTENPEKKVKITDVWKRLTDCGIQRSLSSVRHEVFWFVYCMKVNYILISMCASHVNEVMPIDVAMQLNHLTSRHTKLRDLAKTKTGIEPKFDPLSEDLKDCFGGQAQVDPEELWDNTDGVYKKEGAEDNESETPNKKPKLDLEPKGKKFVRD